MNGEASDITKCRGLIVPDRIYSPDKNFHDLHRRGAAIVESMSGAFPEEVGMPRSDLHGPSSVQVQLHRA